MTIDEFHAALQHLKVSLPWAYLPGSISESAPNPARNRQAWSAYVWNPPIELAHEEPYQVPDPDADPKPTFPQLEAAVTPANLVRLRKMVLWSLRAQCQRRISIAYDADDWTDEMQKRLSGRTTTVQDVERDRLRARHVALKAWADDAARTVAEIEAFDATGDTHWAVGGND